MSNETENQAHGPEGNLIYEVGFHILPTVSSDEVQKLAGDFETSITNLGGAVMSKEMPEKMTLAYRMVKKEASQNHSYAESYFGWIKFEAEAEVAQKVDEVFKESEQILRYLLVKSVREDVVYHTKEEEVAETEDLEEEKESEDAPEKGKETEDDEKDGEGVDEKKLDEALDRVTTA